MSGVGLFETMLIVRGRVVQAEEHHARMAASAQALGFPPPPAFPSSVETELDEAALRCSWIPEGHAEERRRLGGWPGGVSPREGAQARDACGPAGEDAGVPKDWELVTQVGPIPEVTLSRRRHGRVITLDPAIQRDRPTHKLTDWTVCANALRTAVAAGADEALFMTPDGCALEGTSTNVFAIRERTLITAPVSAGILPGVVRATILALGFDVEERPPTVDELRAGSFLTSSLTGVTPIRALDGLPCTVPDLAFWSAVAEPPL